MHPALYLAAGFFAVLVAAGAWCSLFPDAEHAPVPRVPVALAQVELAADVRQALRGYANGADVPLRWNDYADGVEAQILRNAIRGNEQYRRLLADEAMRYAGVAPAADRGRLYVGYDAATVDAAGTQRLMAEQHAAREKARALLLANLSPEQQAQYVANGWFLVKAGRRTYRIKQGHSHNVELLDASDAVVRTFCAYPTQGVPDEDAMLAQKLMLETDEGEFLSIANAAGPAGWNPGMLPGVVYWQEAGR